MSTHAQIRVIANTQVSPDFFSLQFSGSPRPSPGQFFTIRVSDSTVPLLRRPFAYSGYDRNSGTASMIYQKRGPGTEVLAGKQPGDTLDIIGPLGKGFWEETRSEKRRVRSEEPPSTFSSTSTLFASASTSILVAGGVGLGPILFLADHLRESGLGYTFVFGCRTKDQIPNLRQFREHRPVVCTDDGSDGFHGNTVQYLETLGEADLDGAALYTCGPTPMLKGCHLFAEKHKIPCQVSMEQTMACGVGACMGCVVKTKSEPGYARVCKEGPVFESKTIQWE